MKHLFSLSSLLSIFLFSSSITAMQLVFKDTESQEIHQKSKLFMSEVQSEYQLCLHTNKRGLTQKLNMEKINILVKETKDKISLIEKKLEQSDANGVILIELHRALNKYEIALEDLCEINHELYEKTLEHGKKKTYNELIPKSSKLSERVIEWQTMAIRSYKYSNTKLKQYKARKISIARRLYFEQGAMAIEKMISKIKTIFEEALDAIDSDLRRCQWDDYKKNLHKVKRKYKEVQEYLVEKLSIYTTENNPTLDSNNEIEKYFSKYTPRSPYIKDRIAGWKILSKKLAYCIDEQIIEADRLWLDFRKTDAKTKINLLCNKLKQTYNVLLCEFNSVRKPEFKITLAESLNRFINAIEYVREFSFT